MFARCRGPNPSNHSEADYKFVFGMYIWGGGEGAEQGQEHFKDGSDGWDGI